MRQRGVDLDGRAFPFEVIDYIEGAEPGAAGQHILVQGPAFVDPSGQLDRLAVGRADPLPLAFTCLQTLFTVYTMHRLVIDLPAFPAQRNGAVADSQNDAPGGKLDDPFA